MTETTPISAAALGSMVAAAPPASMVLSPDPQGLRTITATAGGVATVVTTGAFSSNTPDPLPGLAFTEEAHNQIAEVMATADPLKNPLPIPNMPEPVAASNVTADTSDGTTVHDVVYSAEAQAAEGKPVVSVSFPQPPAILKHFEFGHLPLHLASISQEFHRLAHVLHSTLPEGPELSAGLRKLLEAKDCAVRAAKP